MTRWTTRVPESRCCSHYLRVISRIPATAKKNFVWTCNKDTKEQAYNDGNVVAMMRITDLKA
jgi:hypothetical protein